MWIFLGIVLFILLLITIILLLPVSFIIKSDPNGEFIILYKILFKTFGEDPNPNQPIVKVLKDISGIKRLDKKEFKQSTKNGELFSTLREDLNLIIDILKKLLELLKNCKIKSMKIDIICAEEDAAKTAIAYGTCYAVISPLINLVHNSMKIRKKAQKINIQVDYHRQEPYFNLDIILVTPLFRVVGALLKLAYEEAKRISESGDKKTKTINSKNHR